MAENPESCSSNQQDHGKTATPLDGGFIVRIRPVQGSPLLSAMSTLLRIIWCTLGRGAFSLPHSKLTAQIAVVLFGETFHMEDAVKPIGSLKLYSRWISDIGERRVGCAFV